MRHRAIPSPLAAAAPAAIVGALAALLAAPTSAPAQDFEDVEIRTTHVRGSIHMLQGSGGNIGVLTGDDGTLIVDDQYAPLTERIRSAIAELTDHPVSFLINTHWHFDHSDGNENFGRAGALIVSQENSRERMTRDQFVSIFERDQEAYSEEGLPKVTFDESMRFHLNDETIDVFHPGPAHTDGDALIYFRDTNVVHTGDVFVRYGFPFIDQPNGGSIDGILRAVETLAEITDDETIFIPGHGDLSDRSDLLAYGEMLSTIRARVWRQLEEGRSLEDVIESDPTEGYPEQGIATDDFVRTVYESLRAAR